MKVTERTIYSDFAGVEKYLQDNAADSLYKSAQRVFGEYEHLTLARFFQCCEGNFGGVLDLPARAEFWARLFRIKSKPQEWYNCPTVLQIYWIKGFGEWSKGFAEMLKRLQVPQTAEEKQAQEGLPKMTYSESLLVFARSYFGLPSFDAAEKITLAEITIAKHDTYCAAMYQKKLHAIQIKKARAKK